MTAGLPTQTPKAKKLWQVSEIFKKLPFPGELIDYNEAQLDWCLEMYAAHHPDEYTFTRGGQSAVLSEPERLAAWDRVTLGKAKQAFMPKLPLAAMRAYDATLGKALSVLKNAVSRP